MFLKTVNVRKNIAFIKPANISDKNIGKILKEIEDYIASEKCKRNIILDLTRINLLDCIKIGVLTSTYHFVKFVNSKTYIVVHDKQAKNFIEQFNLSNAVVIYNQNQLSLENIA